MVTSTSAEQCPGTNPVYWKDDSNTIEQLAFTSLFFFSIILTLKNLYSIRVIFRIRKELEIRKLLTINLLLLFLNIINLALFGDGLVSLFVEGGYLDLQFYYFFKYQGIYVLQILLASAWYKWAPLLAISYQYPREKTEKIAFGLMVFFIVFFLAELGWINGVIFHQDICTVIAENLDPLEVPVILAIISITFNDGIFVAGCYLVSKKIKALCQYKDHKSITRMRILALVTFYGSLFRLINDILFYIPGAYLYANLAGPGNEVGANFFQQAIWALNIMLTYLSCNLIPMTFLAINFSPVEPKKDLMISQSSKTTDDDSASIPSNQS